MNRLGKYAALFFFLKSGTLLAAFPFKTISLELHGGTAYNFLLPLKIKQTGYPDIRIEKANYYTDPFNDPFYWDARISLQNKNRSIELEAIHHKLYLRNIHPDVQHFAISHGFNMILLNTAWHTKYLIIRAGAGTILIHPESTVRNLEFASGTGPDWPGYRLRGISAQVAVARRINFGKHFFINAEGKITGGVTDAEIVAGMARVHSVALHFILGPGFNLKVREKNKAGK